MLSASVFNAYDRKILVTMEKVFWHETFKSFVVLIGSCDSSILTV
jgi:hypothetical protein